MSYGMACLRTCACILLRKNVAPPETEKSVVMAKTSAFPLDEADHLHLRIWIGIDVSLGVRMFAR